MSNFEKAIAVVLKHEGGYVNNPNDSGGETKYGVSLRFLQGLSLDVGDINRDGRIDGADIRNMNLEDAKSIYKAEWWNPRKYDRINDVTIATKVFDFAINMGWKQAHKLLQRAINRVTGRKVLEVDGILGNVSFSTINSFTTPRQQQQLINAFSDTAWDYYQLLIRNNPKLAVFRNGWKNRAYSISKAGSIC